MGDFASLECRVANLATDAARKAMEAAKAAQAKQQAQQAQQGGQQGAQGAQGGQGAQGAQGAQSGQQTEQAQQASLNQGCSNNEQRNQQWQNFQNQQVNGANGANNQAGQGNSMGGLTEQQRNDLYKQLTGKDLASPVCKPKEDDMSNSQLAKDAGIDDIGKTPKDDQGASAQNKQDDKFKALTDQLKKMEEKIDQLMKKFSGGTGQSGSEAASQGQRARRGSGAEQAASGAEQTGNAGPAGSGRSRQVKGYRPVDQKKLEDALPPQAKHLAKAFIDAGKKNNLDPVALAAIAKHETGNFTSSAFKNKNNAMGVSGRGGPMRFGSAAESIDKMAKTLAKPNGYYKNASSIAQIGNIYAPTKGATNDPRGLNNHWVGGVSKYADDLERRVRP